MKLRTGWRRGADERSWLAELRAFPPNEELSPGLVAADLLAFHARPPTPARVRYRPGVHYRGWDRRRVLYLYSRADPTERRAGVLFVHGGAWTEGHPFQHIRRTCLLSARGFVAATLRYRRATEAAWPASLDDVEEAVRWMVAHCGHLGLDPTQLFLGGDSAGAHLALLAARRLRPDLVRGLVLWSPVTDLRFDGGVGMAARAVIGDDERELAAASPVLQVDPTFPPVLSLTGDCDDLVSVASVRAFHTALDGQGVPNRLVVYPGAGHAFDFEPQAWEASFDECVAFLEDLVRP